jgi:hypothetical protein
VQEGERRDQLVLGRPTILTLELWKPVRGSSRP